MPFVTLDPDLDQGSLTIDSTVGNATGSWSTPTSIEATFTASRATAAGQGSRQLGVTQPIETPLPTIGSKIVTGAVLIGSYFTVLTTTDGTIQATAAIGVTGMPGFVGTINAILNHTTTPETVESGSGVEGDIFASLEAQLGAGFTVQDVVDFYHFFSTGILSCGDFEGGSCQIDFSFISLRLEYDFQFAYTPNPASGDVDPGDEVSITSPGTNPLTDLDLSELEFFIEVDGEEIPIYPTVQTQQLVTFVVPSLPPGTPDYTISARGGTQFSGSVGLVVYTVTMVDGSGIYVLTPGKLNDTVYTDSATDDDTIDLPIPQPFGKTGFVGG